LSSAVPAATGVVIDTAVFGARLSPARASVAEEYTPLVAGRAAYVSFVTVAELRFGARLANWGQPRLRRLENLLSAATVVWPSEGLVDTYADLRHDCVRLGHGLSQKDHEADRWVAASALWLGVPLVAHDGIFRDVPGLDLVTLLA
jgi:predicted nucleic acid-binding protein